MATQVGTNGTENTPQGVMATHQVWDREYVTRSHGTDENGGKFEEYLPFQKHKVT